MVADAGFDAIELFASRPHVDYHDAQVAAAARALAGGDAADARERPRTDCRGPCGRPWQQPWSNAAGDAARRELAVRETLLSLDLARVLPYETLVLHVGVPHEHAAGGDNQRDAARRSLEAIAERATDVDVALALEVIPNDLSSADALVRLLESDIDVGDAGVCLDFGHAHLAGDVVEAVETLSGYVIATHVHDNKARQDDHLMPFEGSIDWAGALLALQKVGYDGRLTFELAGAAEPGECARPGAPGAAAPRIAHGRQRPCLKP